MTRDYQKEIEEILRLNFDKFFLKEITYGKGIRQLKCELVSATIMALLQQSNREAEEKVVREVKEMLDLDEYTYAHIVEQLTHTEEDKNG